jgi:Fe2+ or Zn2+ uptake regulation protein
VKRIHLLCSYCRQVLNVQAVELAQIAIELARGQQFDEIDYSLTIVGRCSDCATAAYIGDSTSTAHAGQQT